MSTAFAIKQCGYLWNHSWWSPAKTVEHFLLECSIIQSNQISWIYQHLFICNYQYYYSQCLEVLELNQQIHLVLQLQPHPRLALLLLVLPLHLVLQLQPHPRLVRL